MDHERIVEHRDRCGRRARLDHRGTGRRRLLAGLLIALAGVPLARPAAAATPTMSVSATPAATSYDTVGQTMSIAVSVTNTGDVDLSMVDVTVSGAAVDHCSESLPVAALAPASSLTCTVSRTISQHDLDAGSVVVRVDAAGTDPGGGSVAASSGDVVLLAAQHPSLSITGHGSAGFASVDEVVAVSFVLTNSGNVTITSAQAAVQGAALGTCVPSTPVDLAPGDTVTCDASQTATQADLDNGEIVAVGLATGWDPAGAAVPATSPAVVVPSTARADLHVLVTPGIDRVTALGTTVPYTVEITNVGAQTLSGIDVRDVTFPMTCAVALPSPGLAPGGKLTCWGTRDTVQADLDAGRVSDLVVATARRPDGSTVTSPAATVEVPVEQASGLSLTKTARLNDGNANQLADPGERIDYVLTARNQGNVTVADVTIADTMLPNMSCSKTQPVTLAPGETNICIGSHTVDDGDIADGVVLNIATVRGTGMCPAGAVCVTEVRNRAEAAVTAPAMLATAPSEQRAKDLPVTGSPIVAELQWAVLLVGFALWFLAPAPPVLGDSAAVTRRRSTSN